MFIDNYTTPFYKRLLLGLLILLSLIFIYNHNSNNHLRVIPVHSIQHEKLLSDQRLQHEISSIIPKKQTQHLVWGNFYIQYEGSENTDNAIIFLPYVLIDSPDVSTSGTSRWEFNSDILCWDLREYKIPIAAITLNQSNFNLSVDHNTFLSSLSGIYDNYNLKNNSINIKLHNKFPYFISIGTSTLNSIYRPHQQCTASFVWYGEINQANIFHTQIPFRLQISFPYYNNM